MDIKGTLVDKIWDTTSHDWLFSPSLGIRGQSGGLLTSWDKNDFTLLDHEIMVVTGFGSDLQLMANLFRYQITSTYMPLTTNQIKGNYGIDFK